jgi:hypothetical protein
VANLSEEPAINRLLHLNLRSLKRKLGSTRRAQHPKHHGVVVGTFRVHANSQPQLSQGIFAKAQDYPALVRFSNGRVTDDRKADAHGMAIKVLNVPGTKLLAGREQECAQDFVLVDSETFFSGDPDEYELIHRVTHGAGPLARLSAGLRLLLHPRLLMRIRAFIGKRPRSPLASDYFSAVPYRLGEMFVKYVVKPRDVTESAELKGPNGLAEALAETLAKRVVVFDFGVDLQVDRETQPIDDPTRAWSRAPSAQRIWLAELILPKQAVDAALPLAENLSFSPWHSLPQHEPVGFINRAREPIYRAMAKERHILNQISPAESSEAPSSYGATPSMGIVAGDRRRDSQPES